MFICTYSNSRIDIGNDVVATLPVQLMVICTFLNFGIDIGNDVVAMLRVQLMFICTFFELWNWHWQWRCCHTLCSTHVHWSFVKLLNWRWRWRWLVGGICFAFFMFNSCSFLLFWIDVAHSPSMVTWANQRQILMWEAGVGGGGFFFVQYRSLESIRNVGHMGVLGLPCI